MNISKLKCSVARWLRNPASGLQDIVFDLAESLDPILPPQTQVQRDGQVTSMLARVELRRKHPCQRCDGDGYITVSAGTDTTSCPRCKGACVDPSAFLTRDNA